MLDGPVTDSLEARALTYAIDHIDIFRWVWGGVELSKGVVGVGLYGGGLEKYYVWWSWMKWVSLVGVVMV